jgi:hypothetical protein
MKRIIIILIIFGACFSAARAQRFFNLTVNDVRIDSVLPRFAYSIPLGRNYADSIYEIEIRYPEFIDLSKRESELYDVLSNIPPPTMPEISKQIVVERKRGSLEFSFVPIVEREGRLQFMVSFMIALTARPVGDIARKAREGQSDASIYAQHSVLRSGKWAKIRVPASGVYQITPELVRQAGFTDVNKVRIYGYGGNLQDEVLKELTLRELDDLPEVASCTVNGRRLFYGKGPVSWPSITSTKRIRNPYSQYGYYFLTENDGAPLSVDSVTFMSKFYERTNDYYSLHEVDNFSWYHGGRNLFENTPIAVGQTQTYTMPNKANSALGRLIISITSGPIKTTVAVSLNDSIVDNISINRTDDYDKGAIAERNYRVRNLKPTDTVKITTLSGGPARLDYIAFVYDIPRPVPNLATGTFSAPEYVHRITNQDLHSHTSADMVIIIPTSQKLLDQAQRLADFHKEHDSMNVRIVPADELYNEFSSGTPDIMAYRRYLKMLYDRAETEAQLPKSVLLFGDCVWDNRILTTDCSRLNPDDYLLAYESENSFSETDCYVNDGWITLLDAGEGLYLTTRDKEDMGVGRFPVTEVSDAKTLVDKTINYALNKNAGNWENIIMFMGDDGNNNLHMRDVNETAEIIMQAHPSYHVKKVMWDAYVRTSSATGHTYPEVSAIIKQQQAQGALVMDYAGHGSEIEISHERVLRITDFAGFTNSNLPLWITASCDIMPFDGTTPTIGETCLLNKKGGAMAFWGTTRTVYANYNKPINTAFMRHVLSFTNGKPTTLGEAQRLAKCDMIETGNDRTRNKLQYSLLGDPALSLNLPTLKAIIDSINGKPVGGSEQITLKAGSIVKVTGYIAKGSKSVDNFRGTMTATVRDTRELITCRKQDNETYSPFRFYDRQKILYNGTDSVIGGRFEFTFAVPRDINYANSTGLINVYAANTTCTLTAHGNESRFYIDGTEQVANDSIGPSLFCYLNSPSFVNGGNVNTTPYFVAQISDKDGINAAGNGVGHDMQLIIDGTPAKTYNLNENFKFDFGSYTKGETHFSIPALKEGPHQLQFRAWDILNNPSTATLSFNVMKGLAPETESISCTKNPATTQTSFIVAHNHTGSSIDIEIEVFDTSGRRLWQNKEYGVSNEGSYTYDWNLIIANGAKLRTGVYLYRVKLTCDGATRESKAKKLIVINNN